MSSTHQLAAHPLMSDAAGAILSAALRSDGVTVAGWQRTSVSPRGSSLSVLFDVDVDGADAPTIPVVAHTSQRTVPPGAAIVHSQGHDVHVWRVPHDPYLPGLAAAVDPAAVRALLDGLGVRAGDVALTTRSYRPTRRAVIAVAVGSPADLDPVPVLYLKVLGGRTRDRVAERARELGDTHRTLGDVLPVPPLIGVAPAQGIVAIGALSGETLRSALFLDHAVPPARNLVAVTQRLATVSIDTSANPRRYADVRRHIDVLADGFAEMREAMEDVATFADSVGGPDGTVHGDLHDGQLLVRDAAVTGLLDVDGVGHGLLAQDAGRLVAYVESGGWLDQAVPARVDRFVRQLVDEFVAAGVPLDDLAAGAAGAWLGMATTPFRLRPDGWRHKVRARIERAVEWTRTRGRGMSSIGTTSTS